ncbi:hypothetical protein, partial [Streptomyces sp. NPDC002403]
MSSQRNLPDSITAEAGDIGSGPGLPNGGRLVDDIHRPRPGPGLIARHLNPPEQNPIPDPARGLIPDLLRNLVGGMVRGLVRSLVGGMLRGLVRSLVVPVVAPAHGVRPRRQARTREPTGGPTGRAGRQVRAARRHLRATIHRNRAALQTGIHETRGNVTNAREPGHPAHLADLADVAEVAEVAEDRRGITCVVEAADVAVERRGITRISDVADIAEVQRG